MKKIVSFILIIAILVGTLFVLTGCESGKSGVNLKLDFKHMNDKVYNAHINKNADDEVTEFDEDEPNFVRIENEKENYVIDLTLDTEAKEAYEQFETSAKEENELYVKTDLGKFKGYYSKDNDDIYGYILLDESDSTFNVFVMFDVYLYDDESDNNDIEKIFNSSNIQNIINKIEFKTSK